MKRYLFIVVMMLILVSSAYALFPFNVLHKTEPKLDKLQESVIILLQDQLQTLQILDSYVTIGINVQDNVGNEYTWTAESDVELDTKIAKIQQLIVALGE